MKATAQELHGSPCGMPLRRNAINNAINHCMHAPAQASNVNLEKNWCVRSELSPQLDELALYNWMQAELLLFIFVPNVA